MILPKEVRNTFSETFWLTILSLALSCFLAVHGNNVVVFQRIDSAFSKL